VGLNGRPKNLVAKNINDVLERTLKIAAKDLKWWEKLLPWKKIYKRGFYAGITYSQALQEKGVYGKKVIGVLGKALRDSTKVQTL